MADVPRDNFVTTIEDSRRWRSVVRRPDDIIISTPPKSGTTWMQGIVYALLWPANDAPSTRGQSSPWVDARDTPIESLVEHLESQSHRRFLKTHSPGDCIPFDARCKYVAVYRDGRDALVSWGNHRAKMRPEVVSTINKAAAADGVGPIPLTFDGDYDELFEEWAEICSPIRHLAGWWDRRHAPNVLLVHYADLTHDLASEMRRIADFLDIAVDDELWPQIVSRCALDAMRVEAEEVGGMDRAFIGGASAFFNQGVNGRWKDILSADQVERYLALVDESLPGDAAEWLEHGSRELGVRPAEMGQPSALVVETAPRNPMAGRAKTQSSNSFHAISERRVAQARDEGLFDNLALHGKPIPDIDRQRPEGWWTQRFVQKERNKVKAIQLEEELRSAMPALWRLDAEADVESSVGELNGKIDAYNKVTTLAPMARLDLVSTLATWRRMQDRHTR